MLGEKRGRQLQVIESEKLKIPISLFKVMAIFQQFVAHCKTL